MLFTLIPADPTWAKALVAAGAFGLMALEIRAIQRDRAAHDEEMARLRRESEERFKATLAEFATTHANAERVHREMEKIQSAFAQMARLPAGHPQLPALLEQARVSAATIQGIVSIPSDSPFRVAETVTPILWSPNAKPKG